MSYRQLADIFDMRPPGCRTGAKNCREILARMDGAPISSIRIAANKAWTAARERKSTQEIGEKARHPEKGHDIAYYGDPKFVGWGGGVPVWQDGQVVGAVAVSGLSSSEDVALATLGIELVTGKEKKGR